ncbi:flagellar biosynthetic protein FlhB [Desulfoluna spongiiphila]|uniref:Flagellar biosynthetic protein FlhB n=2 Tax=Desulfoluna spongiiphila TaxID=419481 RepID=A0A1G5AJQ2_9BACT|nr:flagellar biosynthetic protein FlhB [Desulfoluna spongiiphila]VVS90530.1 flagellar biosynthetic protein flhb [Desulfoluna spongiiphila]
MQEKTEPATPKKREKAREEGDVARSAELPSVFVLLGAIVILLFTSGFISGHFEDLFRDAFGFESVQPLTIKAVVDLCFHMGGLFLLIMAPVLLAVFVLGLFANVIMVGFVISPKAVMPKIERIDPIKGFQNKFSLHAVGELVKSLAKLTLIIYVSWVVIRGELSHIPLLYDESALRIFLYMGRVAFKIFLSVTLPMVAVAIADYLFQRWRFEEKLKMTRQEVKEEHKEMEGDPLVKSRIRNLQIEASRKRMMHEVPDADVVVVNPVRLAVAISYKPGQMPAPKVVAKGAGKIAQRIREIARENGVPLVENRPLARNLYKVVEVGREIPDDLFQAVAELLAYVFRLKGR